MFFPESYRQGMKENVFGKSDRPKGNTPVKTQQKTFWKVIRD